MGEKLTTYQRLRYGRNIGIEDFGEARQLKLLKSRVVVIGCGALGSIVSAYIVGAGVGNVVLVDYDTIDISNLQRQVLYTERMSGMSKAQSLAHHLSELNPEISIETIEQVFSRKNAGEILSGADFVIDATDNPGTKNLIDEMCESYGIACCIGGVNEMRGQVMTLTPRSEMRYRMLFPEVSDSGFLPCSIGGVLGPAAGVLASLQAAETIKYIAKIGTILNSQLISFDLKENEFQTIQI